MYACLSFIDRLRELSICLTAFIKKKHFSFCKNKKVRLHKTTYASMYVCMYVCRCVYVLRNNLLFFCYVVVFVVLILYVSMYVCT